jgi:hypothetical protein
MSTPLKDDVDFFDFEECTSLATVNAESDADLFSLTVLPLQEHTEIKNILAAQERDSFYDNFSMPATAIGENYSNWIEHFPGQGAAGLNIATPESASSTREVRITSSVMSSSSLGADSIRNRFSNSALSESDISVSCCFKGG